MFDWVFYKLMKFFYFYIINVYRFDEFVCYYQLIVDLKLWIFYCEKNFIDWEFYSLEDWNELVL